MDNNRLNLVAHWAELGESCHKICLKEIPSKDLMVIPKGFNSTSQLRILDERETKIRQNQANIQVIEEWLKNIGPTLIPSGSQRVDKPNSSVASNHSGTAYQGPRVTILHNPR
ncbi:hypothetical protein O181_076676 [Austropuccinia psidii MF-1]|uniref:Uncharacterized protein n=1 Tax=Austropuccinia psidii MF-1 TaxID=1389203 RepID=A0A9Q3FGP2_9BASI|nr:hypothetical protein [Austropuccinia psidii MF-1]